LEEDRAIFTPYDFISYMARTRKVPIDTLRIPKSLLITYQRNAYEYAKKLAEGVSVDWWWYGERQPLTVGKYNNTEIGIALLWIGAPAAAMFLEEFIACGAKTIFEVGVAGGLQLYLHPGDIIVVTEAFRDEGTSHQYFPPDVKVESSKNLRESLTKYLEQRELRHFVGPVWSTDGVYRETISKFQRFREAGALAVNMETSAIFAVAKYRNVKAASAHVISDILSEQGWLQAFETRAVRENTEALLKAVFTVLSEKL
jgi:uridine phosphorylase